jgi:DNA-binding GntR family transcriptional regulator
MEEVAHQHRQLHHIVAEHLRAAILDGDFKPGQWLRQQHIAEEMGVSAMPVREALQQLAAEGVVEHVPYRGARVVSFSPQDVADLYAQRSFLESRAARAAADSITAAELAELRTLHARMQGKLALHQLSTYANLNRRFHETIYSASRRDYLIRALDRIWSTFPILMMSYYAQRGAACLAERETQDLEEHDQIIAALESRDGEGAERLMRQHIDENCKELLTVMDCGG